MAIGLCDQQHDEEGRQDCHFLPSKHINFCQGSKFIHVGHSLFQLKRSATSCACTRYLGLVIYTILRRRSKDGKSIKEETGKRHVSRTLR